MSYREPDLAQQVGLTVLQYAAYPNVTSEINTILTALGSDVTAHDTTIETPAAALIPGLPSHTAFTNDILKLVNRAKGGGLVQSQIIAAISHVMALVSKPGVIDVPYVSAAPYPPATTSTVCSCTQGNWDGVPTSYTYQWKRDGTVNLGTAATYTLVAGDIPSHTITCVVTATNAQGSTVAPPSNGIAT